MVVRIRKLSPTQIKYLLDPTFNLPPADSDLMAYSDSTWPSDLDETEPGDEDYEENEYD